MIELEFNEKTKNFILIDNAESTPGYSRQITRFRQYCFPKFKSQKEVTFEYNFVKKYGFKFVYAAIGQDCTKIFFKSTEI